MYERILVRFCHAIRESQELSQLLETTKALLKAQAWFFESRSNQTMGTFQQVEQVQQMQPVLRSQQTQTSRNGVPKWNQMKSLSPQFSIETKQHASIFKKHPERDKKRSRNNNNTYKFLK